MFIYLNNYHNAIHTLQETLFTMGLGPNRASSTVLLSMSNTHDILPTILKSSVNNGPDMIICTIILPAAGRLVADICSAVPERTQSLLTSSTAEMFRLSFQFLIVNYIIHISLLIMKISTLLSTRLSR